MLCACKYLVRRCTIKVIYRVYGGGNKKIIVNSANQTTYFIQYNRVPVVIRRYVFSNTVRAGQNLRYYGLCAAGNNISIYFSQPSRS